MTSADFLSNLKVYLKIKDTDVDNDGILQQAVEAASGFLIGTYSYYILEDTKVDEFYIVDLYKKFYLNAGPVRTLTAYLNNVEVTDNDNKVINNTVYFTDNLGTSGDLAKFEYTLGIDETSVSGKGDLAQATALAAYFYKQADKGLDGVMQYGTGIKESARLYEGIPKSILNYFETRKIFRF